MKEEPQATCEDIVQELQDLSAEVLESAADPAVLEESSHLEESEQTQIGNPENTAAEVSHSESANPIDFSSPSSDPIADYGKTETVEELAGDSAEPAAVPSAAATIAASSSDPLPVAAGEEDSVPPPPTSPFLAAVGAAEGAPTTGHVQTGHSSSAPSKPPRTRGTKGGRHKGTSELIKLWQRDFDEFVDWTLYRKRILPSLHSARSGRC